ncbi:MAG: hypothetical protein Unbinned2250contig1000_34 [Prokaryotic dsDNA virus sp.]|nr:MAG: hypothetical protein Unbinned2250contig1000_34 [Prokaryotic dsDNA virus sp.]
MNRDLCFSSEAAQTYGVDEAVMLHHLAFWVFRNKLNNVNLIDGHTWTWNSARAYSEIFPFWSKDQIRRILMSLEKKGAVISAIHNRAGWDRTKWYTVSEVVQKFYQFEKVQNASGETTKCKVKKRKMDVAKPRHQYQIETKDRDKIETQIVYPYDSDEFLNLWNMWKEDRKNRKIKKYTQVGEQTALKKLQDESNDDESTAIKMIQNSIANGYQGIFPINNKGKNNTAPQKFDKDKLLNHLEQTRNS